MTINYTNFLSQMKIVWESTQYMNKKKIIQTKTSGKWNYIYMNNTLHIVIVWYISSKTFLLKTMEYLQNLLNIVEFSLLKFSVVYEFMSKHTCQKRILSCRFVNEKKKVLFKNFKCSWCFWSFWSFSKSFVELYFFCLSFSFPSFSWIMKMLNLLKMVQIAIAKFVNKVKRK